MVEPEPSGLRVPGKEPGIGMSEELPGKGYTVNGKYREREVMETGPNGPTHGHRPYPPIPQLRPEHIASDAKLYANRVEMLYDLPKNGVCGECGVYEGLFSLSILDIASPSFLHLFDINTSFIMKSVRVDSRVRVKQGDSSTELSVYPNDSFDFIYIDGAHHYEGVKKDADVAKTKVKIGGILAFNDYCAYSFYEDAEYGVKQVVNALCVDGGFQVTAFGFMADGYDDIWLRRIT